MARRTPPPYVHDCGVGHAGGAPLRIELPQDRVAYQLREGGGEPIPFSAVSDADGRRVHWFVDDAWVGEAPSGDTFFWRARPGRFVVRAVDDLGRTETRSLRVEVAPGAGG